MADEADEDLGNEHILEGGEEIFSAIDSVLSTGASMAPDAKDKPAPVEKTQETQQDDTIAEATETAEQKAERARNDKGQFTKEQQEAADKAKAEQAKGDQKTYPDEIKSVKAREHFDALKKVKEESERKASSLEAKVKQYESKIQELESRSGTAAPEVKVLQQEITKLKADLEEREKVLSWKAVEETVGFREGVTAPQKQALDLINKAASTYQLDGRKLDEVLAEPNEFKRAEMLGDIMEGMSERSAPIKTKIIDAVEKYVAAEEKAKEIFANSKGSREYAEQEKIQLEAKAALERQGAYQNANKEVETILKEKFPELTGDEAKWSEIRDRAFKVADFDRMPAKAKAFANMSSWMVMPLMEKYREATKELASLKDVMAKRNGTTLNPAGGRGAVASKPDNDEDAGQGDALGWLNNSIDSVLGGGR